MENESKVPLLSTENDEWRMIIRLLSADNGEWRMNSRLVRRENDKKRMKVKCHCSPLRMENIE